MARVFIDRDILDQLATGYGALLEQVQELDQQNTVLERLLERMKEQVGRCQIFCNLHQHEDKK